MRALSLIATVIISVSTLGAQAQTFKAENDVTVTPLGGGTFAAATLGRYGARGAWCAAADYAIDVLGAPGTARLYVTQPKTTNSGPVGFSLSPGSTTPSAVSSTSAAIRTAGANLSVDHAFQFCYDARIINTR
ncbi:MAG: hypothetical protein AAF307_04820 [Pseudomonadota bacterium]